MSISIDWINRIIKIPRNDLTLIQESPVEVRELNINWFRLQLKSLEDSELGMLYPDTHSHFTEVYLGGIVYARVVEIINNYTIEFEDGQYSVNLVGANSNIGDKINVNQVSVRSNNSAGMTSNSAVEYASFNGGVTVKTSSSFYGTAYPVGTPQQPVNNLRDAMLIAKYRGFTNLYIIDNIVVDEFLDFTEMIFTGSSKTKTHIHIDGVALVNKCEFYEAYVTGVLDGESTLKSCMISDLLYVTGYIEDCVLTSGVIIIGGGSHATFLNCFSGSLDEELDWPVIDLGGFGQSLAIRNFNGGLKIKNKTGPEIVTVDMNSGQVYMDMNTITNGVFNIRGIGKCMDLETQQHVKTGTYGDLAVLNELISRDNIAEAVWDEDIARHLTAGTTGLSVGVAQFAGVVTISNRGINGTNFPIGTQRVPVNNVADAIAIANFRGVRTLYFEDDYVLDEDVVISEFTLKGRGRIESVLIFNKCTLENCIVRDVIINGECIGIVEINNCTIRDYIRSYNSSTTQTLIIEDTLLEGTISIPSNFVGIIQMVNCTSIGVLSIHEPTLNINNSNIVVVIKRFSGALVIKNCSNTHSYFSIDYESGRLKLENTITGGFFTLRGISIFQNYSVGATINVEGLINKATTSEAVWDEPLVNHIIPGSTGQTISISKYSGRVHIDTINGTNNLYFPHGTHTYPVNTLESALIINSVYNFNALCIIGDLIITQDLDTISLYSYRTFTIDRINLNNKNFTNVIFYNLYLFGSMTGFNTTFNNCYINNVENISGEIIGGRINGLLKVEPGNILSGINVVVEGDNTTIDLQNSPDTIVSLDVNSGIITFINCVTDCLIELNLRGGEIVLDSSCTGGEFYAEGYGTLYNNSNMTVTDNHLLALETLDPLSKQIPGTSGTVGSIISNTNKIVNENQALLLS
jgi:hypothetical protein